MLRLHSPQPQVLQGLPGILRIPTGSPRIPIPSQNSHLRPGGPFPGPSTGILRPSGPAWPVSFLRTTAPVTVSPATASKSSRAPTMSLGCSSRGRWPRARYPAQLLLTARNSGQEPQPHLTPHAEQGPLSGDDDQKTRIKWRLLQQVGRPDFVDHHAAAGTKLI